ncbi:GNAT family N-acetyltransferase [Pilimelia columellifera]|uniref:N-acetyltransferase domain-containing protein n=1 Tax=Pilimelia columellifera subsp. columellifera TaxID=706583 RepID=A0ABP6AI29_9ACTN
MDRRLLHHLAAWLGQWPTGRQFQVVGSSRRSEPGWDGVVCAAVSVASPAGEILSVAPDITADVRRLARGGPEHLAIYLPALLGFPQQHLTPAVFRWCERPAELPELGEWTPADDAPPWLKVFGGEVLVSRDPTTGEHQAGVGIKRHSRHGHEIAVVTAAAAQGRGLGRALVAQAARRILDEDAIPLYLNDAANEASARVAVAAGFPDQGWVFRNLR